jgi:hypothetical protein
VRGLCFYVDYAPYVASVLLYGCFYGLGYAVILWTEVCVCLLC